ARFAWQDMSPCPPVVSYTTLSPLPPPEGDGGLLSVALSRGSLRVGVTHRPALWSPDVPRCALAPRDRPADPLALRFYGQRARAAGRGHFPASSLTCKSRGTSIGNPGNRRRVAASAAPRTASA